MVFTDTKASDKLTTLLTNPRLAKDIAKLSPVYQTSSLEACGNTLSPKIYSILIPRNAMQVNTIICVTVTCLHVLHCLSFAGCS